MQTGRNNKPLKILLCHTYYQQSGGEDETFESEAQLLESMGHEVVRWTRHNDEIHGLSRLTVARQAAWNHSAERALSDVIAKERPDVMHATNLFPLMSPSVYRAARNTVGPNGVGPAVVQALRNFRVFCVGGVHTRNGQQCIDCRDKGFGWPGIVHGCYRGSRVGSLAVAIANQSYRRSWQSADGPDLFFTPSKFAKQWYVEGGYRADRIRVKPNYTQAMPRRSADTDPYAIYVGRLSGEKGITVLLSAWREARARAGDDGALGRLVIVGDGPEAAAVQAAASSGEVQWLGRKPQSEVMDLVSRAAFAVVPSIAPETFGRPVIEAYACGIPALAAARGALTEIVQDGVTGLLCKPEDPTDLAAKAITLFRDEQQRKRMGDAARALHAECYSPEQNYQQLLALYHEAIERRRAVQSH